MAHRSSNYDAGRFSELMPDAHDECRIVLKHGEPIGDLFLPFVRIDGVMDAISTMANALTALISERGTTQRRLLVSNGDYSYVVCIQLYQTERHAHVSRIDTIFQGEPMGYREGMSHPCSVHNAYLVDEIPSENDIQTLTLLVHWYLERAVKANRKPLFLIGCQQGLNRTGFVICSLLIRLFGVPVEDAFCLFRKAHYPGIVKQHFIDQLYARNEGVYGDAPPKSIFARFPMALSIENIVHRTIRGSNQSRDRPVRVQQQCAQRNPMIVHAMPDGFKSRSHSTQWLNDRLVPSVANWLYTVTLPRILQTLAKDVPHCPFRTSNGLRPFRNGFVRPLPCCAAELDRHDGDVLTDCAISIKANGRHASLIACPIGVFVIERSETKDVRSLSCAFVSDASKRTPLKLTVLECELIETPDEFRVYAFDALYSEDPTVGEVHTMTFSDRRVRLEALFAKNTLVVPGAKTLRLSVKPFYPLNKALLHTLQHGDPSTLFDSYLCSERGNDGYIVTRQSANIFCQVEGSKVLPHMKLKQSHTVDLLLTVARGKVTASFAHTNGQGTFGTPGFNHMSLESGAVLHYNATYLNDDVEDVQTMGGTGLYECVCVVAGPTFGFRVGHRRMDIQEPNRLVPTIKSCLELTKEGFYLESLGAYMRERKEDKKRKYDSVSSIFNDE
jgi:hypothetical protein